MSILSTALNDPNSAFLIGMAVGAVLLKLVNDFISAL